MLVTDEHRRRLLVDRHLLVSTRRNERGIDDVAAALCLLHSTDPSTPYLSIHARSGASVVEIDAALYDDRSLERSTTIRRTVFAMSPEMARLACGTFNLELVAKLRAQLAKWLDTADEVTEPVEEFLQRAEQHVVEFLSTQSSATGTVLAKDVPELRVMFDPRPNAPSSKPIRVTSKLLEIMAVEGTIVRSRPIGNDFTSGVWTWVLAGEHRRWIDDAPDPDQALAGLLSHHLTSFGPATLTDVAWWTGLPKQRVRSGLDAIRAVDVDLEGVREAGFVADSDELEAPLASLSVSLLPGLDSTTMGWKQRSWYVDDSAAAGIFDRNGNAGPTIWVDGKVVGVWTQRADGEIATESFVDLGSDVADLVEAESARLAVWLGNVRVNWRYPTPMTKRLFS